MEFILKVIFTILLGEAAMIIGIDGGGTKTTGILVDYNGVVVSKATVGASNPNGVREGDIRNELTLLFSLLTEKKPLSKVVLIYAGVSGVESGGKKEWMSSLIKSITGQDIPVIVENDAITALYSGTKGNPGIVTICGTGSITYGLNESGERSRVGGWGYLINDGCSGFALGKSLLEYVFSEFDKGILPCHLTQAVLQHFKLNSVAELIPRVYELGKSRDVVASVGKVVVQNARNNDKTCLNILSVAAKQVVRDINILYEKLFYSTIQDTVTEIVLTGGIVEHSEELVSFIRKEIEVLNKPYHIILPNCPPIVGTIYASLKMLNKEINSRIIDTLEKQLV